jgi:hypothetical protein
MTASNFTVAEVVGDHPALRDADGQPYIAAIAASRAVWEEPRHEELRRDEREQSGLDLLRTAAWDRAQRDPEPAPPMTRGLVRSRIERDLQERYQPLFIGAREDINAGIPGADARLMEFVILVPKETP